MIFVSICCQRAPTSIIMHIARCLSSCLSSPKASTFVTIAWCACYCSRLRVIIPLSDGNANTPSNLTILICSFTSGNTTLLPGPFYDLAPTHTFDSGHINLPYKERSAPPNRSSFEANLKGRSYIEYRPTKVQVVRELWNDISLFKHILVVHLLRTQAHKQHHRSSTRCNWIKRYSTIIRTDFERSHPGNI